MTGLLHDFRGPVADPPELRPYQIEAVEMIEASLAGGGAPLLALATGAGKTVIAGSLIRRVERPCLFLAPRRELVYQASAALARAGVDHGVCMAGREDLEDHWAAVTVASLDTVASRLRRGRRPFVDPQLIVMDEAHLSITERRQALLKTWPDARLVGLTATPSRKDGNALGVAYSEIFQPISVAELTDQGWLVPATYYSLSEPDLARVATVAGDYHQVQLDQAVNQPKLVGDIVSTWLARAGGRRTVVFATSIAHSIALSEAFQRAGVAAEHVDAKTPLAERSLIFERFTRGQTQVLTNCFLVSLGFDLPELSCVVLARPTKSLVLYLQMIGRGLRPADDKSDCLVLDHSGAVHRHGFAADDREWTLDGKYALTAPARQARDERDPMTCPECQAVFERSRICTSCGYEIVPAGREVATIDGELIEIGQGLEPEEIDRRQFFAELRGIAEERNYKIGWAAWKYKERFNTFPPRDWNIWPALEPTIPTRRWIKSRSIAWAKAKQARAS